MAARNHYVELIKKAGVVAQEAPRRFFRRARADARRDEKRLAARAFAGRQIPDLLHAGRTERAVHAIFFHRNHARNFRARNRAGADFCLLRGRPAADGKKPDQGRQPRERDRRARRMRS